MAAVSAPHASTALTPPTSSHGASEPWSYSVPTEDFSDLKDYNNTRDPPRTNGHSTRPDFTQHRSDTFDSTRSADSAYLAPSRLNAQSRKNSGISETSSAPDSLLDLYGSRTQMNSTDMDRAKEDVYEDPDHSRWIHRDKLARIESQELQAAGIILPRSRAASRNTRRDSSRDQQGNGVRSEQEQKRLRMDSYPTEEEEDSNENAGWDLRLPDEAADDHGGLYRDISGGVKGVSRIPVSKASPLPIPMEHLERDTVIPRKKSTLTLWSEDDAITVPKPRGRSESVKAVDSVAMTPPQAKRVVSESSPPKKAPAKKSPSAASRAASSQRPKTRSGPSRDESKRPPTRGENTTNGKRPEGDPPWLSNMYKPDPRLPPDQQLLPTVARRLQQEQWEKEGKFGNAYDTSFRPLNDEQFHQPEASPDIELEEQKPEDTPGPEWPLQASKSSTLTPRPGTSGGYSTMPRIADAPPEALPSHDAPIRLPEPPEEMKKGGCGCCVVM